MMTSMVAAEVVTGVVEAVRSGRCLSRTRGRGWFYHLINGKCRFARSAEARRSDGSTGLLKENALGELAEWAHSG